MILTNTDFKQTYFVFLSILATGILLYLWPVINSLFASPSTSALNIELFNAIKTQTSSHAILIQPQGHDANAPTTVRFSLTPHRLQPKQRFTIQLLGQSKAYIHFYPNGDVLVESQQHHYENLIQSLHPQRNTHVSISTHTQSNSLTLTLNETESVQIQLPNQTSHFQLGIELDEPPQAMHQWMAAG